MNKFLRKNSLTKHILITLLLLFTSSCNAFIEPMPKSWNWGTRPRPLTGVRNFPEADTDYGQGFRDGCMLGFDAVAKGMLNDVEKTLDPKKLANNADYDTGFGDGSEQCVYILDWNVV